MMMLLLVMALVLILGEAVHPDIPGFSGGLDFFLLALLMPVGQTINRRVRQPAKMGKSL
ncbi:hypothetical protein [Methylocaldum sp. 14B]|jgi:hypothetical protein|uniref:hypothetical protein n=1 Tax=Methylocaldum sp. 14B TaxID=1912213 RepID=UPI0012EC23FA|nr:hypothetical protein [Methylocaldum sp. 14B]